MARNVTTAPQWQGLKRVLAVRLDNIGDVLMLQPALRAIRANLPGASLTLFASPAGSQTFGLLPEVDNVISHKVIWQDVRGSWPQDVGREYQLVDEIRRRDFEAAFVFTSFSQSPYPPAYLCYLAGIPLRLGMSKEFGGAILTTWVKSPDDALHQVERNLLLLEQLGFQLSDRDLAVSIPQEARTSLDRKLAGLGLDPMAPFILVHPFTSCQARTYPVYRMAAVARGIMDRRKLPVVVCGHEKDRQRLAQSGPDVWGEAILLAGQTTILEYAALISRARLLIGNNTSSMHLADAVGTPSVIMFSGTELESQWRPRRTRSTLLRKPTACSPCYGFECPYNLECLDFEPEEVLSAAGSYLDGN